MLCVVEQVTNIGQDRGLVVGDIDQERQRTGLLNYIHMRLLPLFPDCCIIQTSQCIQQLRDKSVQYVTERLFLQRMDQLRAWSFRQQRRQMVKKTVYKYML